MNKALPLFALLGLVSVGSIGCGNKSSDVPVSSSVTDVTAPSTGTHGAAPAYTASSPTVAQPVTYDTMPSGTTGGYAANSAGGNSYTVKRGDTLYSIARTKYGDGKQWQKIAGANPGLRPESLKVGQTITLP